MSRITDKVVAIIILCALFVTKIICQGQGISDFQFQLIKPPSPPVESGDDVAIETNKGMLGCALFCLRVATVECKGFWFIPEKKTCVALSVNIEGDSNVSSPEYFIYKRKYEYTTTATTNTITATITTPTTTAAAEEEEEEAATKQTSPGSPPTALSPADICAGNNFFPASNYSLSQSYCVIGALTNFNGARARIHCEEELGGHLARATTPAKLTDYKILLTWFISIPPEQNFKMYVGIRRRVSGGPWLFDYDDQELSDASDLWVSGYPITVTPYSDCVLVQKNTMLYNDVCTELLYAVCEIVL